MHETERALRPLFPKWTNAIPTALLGGATVTLALVVGGFWYYATPKFFAVGYRPTQPVKFSHKIHAGQLGMDCRYCHTHVDESANANIPTTTTCMNCHAVVDDKSGYLKKAMTVDGSSPSAHWVSADLRVLRAAHSEERSLPWRRIHKLPDYVKFNHSAHVNAGVSCYSCHNRIDEMPVVQQSQSLAMAWCLDCHRAPEQALVGKENVTNLRKVEQMLAEPGHAQSLGARLYEQLQKRPPYAPPEHCAACHY